MFFLFQRKEQRGLLKRNLHSQRCNIMLLYLEHSIFSEKKKKKNPLRAYSKFGKIVGCTSDICVALFPVYFDVNVWSIIAFYSHNSLPFLENYGDIEYLSVLKF